MEMIVDGKYELGISSSEAVIYGSGDKNIIKVINTNSLKTPILESSENWLTGLNLSHIRDDLYYLKGNFEATSQERETEVTIKVENLEKTIRIIQKPGEGTIDISIDTLYLSPTRSSAFIELKVQDNASWELESNYTSVAEISPRNGTGNTKIEFKASTRFTNSTYSFKNRDTGETIPIYVGNLNLNIPDTIWVEGAPGTANLPPEMIVAQGGIEDWTLGEVYCISDLYTPSNWLTDAEKIDLNGDGKYRLQLKYTLGAATDKRKAYLPISHVNDKSYIKRVVIMQEQTTVDLEGDYLFFELDYANVTCEITGSPLNTYVRPFLMFEMINGDIPTILSDNNLYTLNHKPLGYGTGSTPSTEIAGQAHFTRSIRRDAQNREIFYWSGADAPYTKYEGFYINVPNLLANFSSTDDIDIIFDFYGLWTINRTEDPILIKIKGYDEGDLVRTVIKEINTDPSIPGNWPGFYTFHNDGGYLTFQGIYRKRLLQNGNTELASTFRDSYSKIAQITFNTKTKKTKVNFVIDE
ncbi:MAG: hypothetical protein LIO65_10355 [Odoribacter sp.]|nr:hypothetical protein [Odoribacter sp.]